MLKWTKHPHEIHEAVCGPFQVSVCLPWKCRRWRMRASYVVKGRLLYSGPIGKIFKTESAAKFAASKWLRIQAASMLRDLGEGK